MYSQLRVIGQIFAGYIALETEEGLLLIDQHARTSVSRSKAAPRNSATAGFARNRCSRRYRSS